VPGRDDEAGPDLADDRAVVRAPGPQASHRLGEGELTDRREHAHRVVQQVMHCAGRDLPVGPLILSRPDD
jgi:hypothetical protein